MSKIIQRLLIFFVGIPVVICFIIPLFLNHLPLQFLITIFSFMSAWELHDMLAAKNRTFFKPLIIFLSVLLPVISYLCGLFKINFDIVGIAFTIECLVIFAVEAFTTKDFSESNIKIANGIFTIAYSGLLPTFISRLTVFDHSIQIICLFVILVFISDSAAWLIGMLFGKNNRGIIAVSPNKSVAGFIGAYLGTILFAILSKYVFFKDLLGQCSFVKLIILAVVVTTASIIGDLAESVFKRSCGFKDSGNVILGRGGALDSIDSMFAAAPFYYIIVEFIF